MNKRSIGALSEARAAAYLESRGLKILCRNYRCRLGEIDLIAKDGEVYVFAEVKYRKNTHFGLPEQAVDRRKQQQIQLAAAWFAMEGRCPQDAPIRFDVLAMDDTEIRWYADAFS